MRPRHSLLNISTQKSLYTVFESQEEDLVEDSSRHGNPVSGLGVPRRILTSTKGSAFAISMLYSNIMTKKEPNMLVADKDGRVIDSTNGSKGSEKEIVKGKRGSINVILNNRDKLPVSANPITHADHIRTHSIRPRGTVIASRSSGAVLMVGGIGDNKIPRLWGPKRERSRELKADMHSIKGARRNYEEAEKGDDDGGDDDDVYSSRSSSLTRSDESEVTDKGESVQLYIDLAVTTDANREKRKFERFDAAYEPDDNADITIRDSSPYSCDFALDDVKVKREHDTETSIPAVLKVSSKDSTSQENDQSSDGADSNISSRLQQKMNILKSKFQPFTQSEREYSTSVSTINDLVMDVSKVGSSTTMYASSAATTNNGDSPSKWYSSPKKSRHEFYIEFEKIHLQQHLHNLAASSDSKFWFNHDLSDRQLLEQMNKELYSLQRFTPKGHKVIVKQLKRFLATEEGSRAIKFESQKPDLAIGPQLNGKGSEVVQKTEEADKSFEELLIATKNYTTSVSDFDIFEEVKDKQLRGWMKAAQSTVQNLWQESESLEFGRYNEKPPSGSSISS
ncbi:uncharacterized protein Ecym_6363 [Eremothecium cymbalariae DBVPG|uniref:Uncharacterized protein n=1 Tax=Eremothecium cymbalariae (strain CBS 270.75 / DBVPG 7215 / KCTC 17166 / NRRL Y-17582) TaxID=931890 RepID=G8JUF9_ERECY|nr:hypothetical protein Ecym_6363 [Eremothecium cymbalariae DBVPG\